MKKKLLFLMLPVIFYADSLKSLLYFAHHNNSLVIAKELSIQSKQKEVEAARSAYYPTIDVGGFYQRLDDKSPMLPGDVYSGYAKVGFDIYDGGRRSNTIKQKQEELKATGFEKSFFIKSLSLQIIQDFYTIKNIDASILSLKEEKKSLHAQLQRVKKFYKSGLATKDNIDKLQAAYDTNAYHIESMKFQRLSLLHALELKTGKKIDILEKSEFKKVNDAAFETDENIKALKAQNEALQKGAESLNSAYKPNIRIEDSYNLYVYGRDDSTHPEGLDNQNKIMLSLNMRLFDNGMIDKNREVLMLNSKALQSQITYKSNEQKMQYDLALSSINTAKLKIQSAKSALTAARSAYTTIEKKYKADIVDNVAYLDALSKRTSAKARYENSLNDLEIAYAFYYYYAGKNIGEFIK